jgi:predicted transcriptional regulator
MVFPGEKSKKRLGRRKITAVNEKRVKDLMVPIDEYPVVSIEATLLDVVNALHESHSAGPPDREPPRAVLVMDEQKRIVGKIGHLLVLKAVESQQHIKCTINALTSGGVGQEFVEWMVENLRFWQEDISDLCRRVRKMPVKEAMLPIHESIDAESSLGEAIHGFVAWQTLSLLVTRQGEIVGILRLADVYQAVAAEIRNARDEDAKGEKYE